MGIHKFEMNGEFVVVDICTANCFSVDRLAYNVLDYYPSPGGKEAVHALAHEFGEEEAAEAASEVDRLIAEGKLFSPEPAAFANEAQAPLKPKAMCLNIAHDCNLACEYCFASGGNFQLQREEMPFSVAKAAVDFLIRESVSPRLEIDFFGGEPLMNWDVLRQTVNYARSRENSAGKRFRFTATTNAYLLDEEKLSWLNGELDNLVLSIDGRKEVHDRMRPTKGGSSSYERVKENILRAVKARGQKGYYARSTFTRHNLDFSLDVLCLASLGIGEISSEPVVASTQMGYAIQPEDLPLIFKEYESLASSYLEARGREGAFHFFHFSIESENEICMKKRVGGCGSGTEYLAVAPSGDLYPCHQFVGQEGFLLGNVNGGFSEEGNALRHKFSSLNVNSKEECRNCWAKYFCGGGCAANAFQYGSGLAGTHPIGCAMLKKRLECALYIKSVEKH